MPENIDRLLNAGVEMIQLNAFSLLGIFRNKRLFEWIDSGVVVALGSDIHGRDTKAYKDFKTAKDKFADKLASVKEASDKIWSEISLYP